MATRENGRPQGEVPAERIKPRVVRRGDAARVAADPLRASLRAAERRFLQLQSLGLEGISAQMLSEHLAILDDLRVIYGRLHEESVRRDIPYVTERRLTFLTEYCRWLTRRVSAQTLLMLEVQIEQELKRIISPEAYQVFLRLEDVVEDAREMETLGDREVMARLADGTLLRGVAEQIRLGSASVPPQPSSGPSEASEERQR